MRITAWCAKPHRGCRCRVERFGPNDDGTGAQGFRLVEALDLIRPALWVARALWWLAWELMVRTIGWSIGWLVWRVLTLGRFPDTGFRELDETSDWAGILVELTGLAVLGGIIWRLGQLVPMW